MKIAFDSEENKKQLSHYEKIMREKGMMLTNIFLFATVLRMQVFFYLAFITWIVTLILLFRKNKSVIVRAFYILFMLIALAAIAFLIYANL